MLLSTRDAQRENNSAQILGRLSITDRLSTVGIENASFRADSTSDIRVLSRKTSGVGNESLPTLTVVDVEEEEVEVEVTKSDEKQTASSRKKGYQWRMTHYFYIHISLFIINGFFCGLIVYLIENHSSVRNRQMDVPYVDAWFVASSCVYNCGLTTLDFAKLSQASQIVLMIFTFISGITISTLPALVVKWRIK
jgi:hypothetical protein